MKEAKWTSYLALSSTYVAAIIAMFLALEYYTSSKYDTDSQKRNYSTTLFEKTLTLGFTVYLFSLGAHPIFPSLYAEMKDKSKWGLVTNLGWIIVCALYFPVAIIGYLVFGNSLNGNDTILATIQKIVGNSVLVIIGEILFTAHFICAIPIFLTPCLYNFNLYLRSKNFNFPDLMTRIIVCVVIIVVALFFPYITDVMSIVSGISTSLSAMILPPIFYWRLRAKNEQKTSKLEIIWLLFIIIVGIVASVIGIQESFLDLGRNVEEHPLSEFFHELFNFNMSKCG